MIRVSCPKCRTILQVEDNHAGQVVACSGCHTSMRLPQAPSAPPSLPVTETATIPKPIQTTPVTAEWHYAKGGKQIGPITEAQLQELAASGKLLPADMVWKQGMPGWAAASSISILFPTSPHAPPPLPPAVVPPAMPSKAAANRVTVELDLPGQMAPYQLDLLLDGVKIATGSAQDGIHHLQFESTVGTHTFTVERTAELRGLKNSANKSYQVQFKKPGHYTLTFKYGWIPLQFPTGIDTTFSPQALESVPTSALRRKSFVGFWQPITEPSEWMEFTNDGAVVFSDGTAGRITISGSQPTEVIEIELVNGQSRQFNVVSLTSDQLVIAENDEATTFRRSTAIAAKRQATGPSDKAEGSAGGDVIMSSSSRGSASTNSSSSQWWDCPWCGVTCEDASYDPGETVVCDDCNCQFQKTQALNLRSTRECVETKSLLGRLWSGSSIQTPRRQRLLKKIKDYEAMIRIYSNPATMGDVQHLQQAQLLQMKIAEMKQELRDHGG